MTHLCQFKIRCQQVSRQINQRQANPINQNQAKKAGFTLVELMVVASLTAILMLAASAVFMTFMIGNAKVRLSQKVKNQGDLAIDQMQFLLRNAQQIVANDFGETCLSSMDQIAFTSQDGTKTILKIVDDEGIDRIASVSAITQPPTNFYLTSDVADVSDLQFRCFSGEKEAKYVEISFRLSKGVNPTPGATPSPNPEAVDEFFKTGVTIRNTFN